MARPVGMKSGNRRHAIDGNPTSRGEKGVEKDRERVAGEAETGKLRAWVRKMLRQKKN
jgi:hypothetical protein